MYGINQSDLDRLPRRTEVQPDTQDPLMDILANIGEQMGFIVLKLEQSIREIENDGSEENHG